MAWRFRRRIKIIPGVHLNFSKSGISTSIGARGASLTFGKAGTYLNTSIPGTGIYNRQKLYKSVINPKSQNNNISERLGENILSDDVQKFTSQDMIGVRKAIIIADEQRKELKNDLLKAKGLLNLYNFKLIFSYVFIYGLINKTINENIKVDIATQKGTILKLNKQIDNCFANFDIEFDTEIDGKYNKVIETFKKLCTSQKIWDVTSSYSQNTIMTRSYAGMVVNKKEVKLGIKSIPEIKSKYETLWFSNANGADIYFYPNFIIIYYSNINFAVISLNEVEFCQTYVKFAETGMIPKDSKIVEKTWAKVNKDGTPDMRFKNNYQIPIVRYGGITLRTDTGLNEVYEFSNYEYTEEFGEAFRDYQKTLRKLRRIKKYKSLNKYEQEDKTNEANLNNFENEISTINKIGNIINDPEIENIQTSLNEVQNKKNNTQTEQTTIIKSIENEPHLPQHSDKEIIYDPKLDLPNFQLPSLSLLEENNNQNNNQNNNESKRIKDVIINTLNNFSIPINGDNVKVTTGPAIFLYEFIPPPGIRISSIRNLEDDLSLSLSVFKVKIAPLPEKGTIGIAVPNPNPEMVSVNSIFSSENFTNTNYELPLCIGKNITNESFVIDLTQISHLLISGASKQGKSVCINLLITSLLFKKHPSQLKFILIDPKKIELSLYSKIERHYLAKLPDSEEAIITDTHQVIRILNSLSIEMDNRYDLLKDAQVRNIKEYNVKFIARKLNPNQGHRFLPYIVLVIDEFADLIMQAGKEIEIPLTRLAQLAHVVGIHLIIATQRPSVNIITGSIKANFPTRIAFRVISKIDSRTILGSDGAEQLIRCGDMLLSVGIDLIHLQCAFIDIREIERITEFIRSQRGYPIAFCLPEYHDESDQRMEEFNANDRDELFEDAARIIVLNQQGSTSLLQQKLKIGYNRAGHIIDQLEAAGIVGPFEGSKARGVNIANEIDLEQYLKNSPPFKLNL